MSIYKKVAAEWNNPVAQYLIGSIYLEGDEEIPKDKKAGARWISLAAEKGWPYAITKIGNILMSDPPVPLTNIKEAITWFEKVAKNDDSETELIKDDTNYLFGNRDLEVNFTHVNQDTMDAVQAALKRGEISAINSKSHYYELEFVRLVDFHCILNWNLLTEKKSSGVLAAQKMLYFIYDSKANNFPRDPNKAFYWCKMIAKNEEPWYCRFLGGCYEKGDGVKKDFKKAMEWHEKGYDLDGEMCSRYAGLMFIFKKDYQKASECFQGAIDRDENGEDMYSPFYLGNILSFQGASFPPSYTFAYRYYKLSFGCGHARAGTKIAGLYYSGLGVQKDFKKTIEWLTKAALKGCLIAKFALRIIALKGFEAAESCMAEINTPFKWLIDTT